MAVCPKRGLTLSNRSVFPLIIRIDERVRPLFGQSLESECAIQLVQNLSARILCITKLFHNACRVKLFSFDLVAQAST